ncbi:hypothetical protein GCM10012275_28460 [Longimycelium tulufanense]|uniref:Uncharacterized protein n=1 Tax=Longimycelium tulufanense TaxID=907463 RepID=A0A8J3FW05_9PSEU|nr:hypothetical protein GCM10012275_28460 [Longimycelium tulufanense]
MSVRTMPAWRKRREERPESFTALDELSRALDATEFRLNAAIDARKWDIAVEQLVEKRRLLAQLERYMEG